MGLVVRVGRAKFSRLLPRTRSEGNRVNLRRSFSGVVLAFTKNYGRYTEQEKCVCVFLPMSIGSRLRVRARQT